MFLVVLGVEGRLMEERLIAGSGGWLKEDVRDSRRRSQAAERDGKLVDEKSDCWVRWYIPGGGAILLKEEIG